MRLSWSLVFPTQHAPRRLGSGLVLFHAVDLGASHRAKQVNDRSVLINHHQIHQFTWDCWWFNIQQRGFIIPDLPLDPWPNLIISSGLRQGVDMVMKILQKLEQLRKIHARTELWLESVHVECQETNFTTLSLQFCCVLHRHRKRHSLCNFLWGAWLPIFQAVEPAKFRRQAIDLLENFKKHFLYLHFLKFTIFLRCCCVSKPFGSTVGRGWAPPLYNPRMSVY